MSLSGFDHPTPTLPDRLRNLAPVFLKCISRYTIERPVKSPVIERGLRIKGPDVRALVNYLRDEGYPIGSDGRGYYLCRSTAELEVTKEHLTQRLNALAAALRGLDKAFKTLELKESKAA